MRPDAQRRRPDPLRWIWYAFGGTLGPRYRQWVLQDLTGRTRWERQIVRAMLQVAPLAAVLLLTLGFGWIAWVGAGCGLVLALIYSLAYFDPSVEHRLAKHGYAPGTAQRILSERDNAKHPDRMRHYMETLIAPTRSIPTPLGLTHDRAEVVRRCFTSSNSVSPQSHLLCRA